MRTPPISPILPSRTSVRGHGASPKLSPSDHVRTIVELLRPAGADLARRWLAALLLVPAEEREEVVRGVEARIAEVYGPATAGATRVTVVHPPVRRSGYVEQVQVTYSKAAPVRAKATVKRARRA